MTANSTALCSLSQKIRKKGPRALLRPAGYSTSPFRGQMTWTKVTQQLPQSSGNMTGGLAGPQKEACPSGKGSSFGKGQSWGDKEPFLCSPLWNASVIVRRPGGGVAGLGLLCPPLDSGAEGL